MAALDANVCAVRWWSRCVGLPYRRAQCHRDEGRNGTGMWPMCWGANRLCVDHWRSSRIVAMRHDVARNWRRRIAGGLEPAQTMLLEPAMQHIGIHAMFTRRGGNRCAGLLARRDQFSLELWRIGAARARHRITRGVRIFEHRVHGCFVDAILLGGLRSLKMGLRAPYCLSPQGSCAHSDPVEHAERSGHQGRVRGMSHVRSGASWARCRSGHWKPD